MSIDVSHIVLKTGIVGIDRKALLMSTSSGNVPCTVQYEESDEPIIVGSMIIENVKIRCYISKKIIENVRFINGEHILIYGENYDRQFTILRKIDIGGGMMILTLSKGEPRD